MEFCTGNNPGIWEKFVAGDKEAFAFFYNMHLSSLYRYGTKLCCDDDQVKDAIQEVFLDVYLKRKSIRSDEGNLRWYLMAALKHNLIKKMKKARSRAGSEQEVLAFEPEYSIEKRIIEKEEEAERNQRIAEVLQSLPSGQKEALYLRFNESMDYREIAGILNITVESVRKQVYRALCTIREKWGVAGSTLLLIHLLSGG